MIVMILMNANIVNDLSVTVLKTLQIIILGEMGW